MEELLPSEIARLVLGFLKENKCEKSWTTFLEECTDLQEYCLLYRRGKLYPTNVNGKSLLDILSEYSILKREPAINSCNIEFSESAFKEKCKIILEETIITLEHIFQKYLPCFCCNNHKGNSSVDATTSVHTSDHRVDNRIELGNEIQKTDESNKTLKEIEVETNTHKNESEVKLSAINYSNDHFTEQSTLIKLPEVSNVNHDLQSVESPRSDVIYVQDIIKVEKDSENCPILECKSKKSASDNTRSRDISSDGVSNTESYTQLHCTENNLNAVLENSHKKVYKTRSHKKIADESTEPVQRNDYSKLKIIKTEKLEPDHSDECTLNKTEKRVNNCFQSNTSASYVQSNSCNAIKISQPSLCNIQSTTSLPQGSIVPINNLVSNINSLNNQPRYAIQTTPFSSQPLAVNDMSFSSVPTYIVQNYSTDSSSMQNNAQYSFVINTPNIWKGAAGSLPLAIPNIHSNNIFPKLTSVESLNTTPSALSVDKNMLSSILPTIDQNSVVSRNTPSVTDISVNASTTDIDAGGQQSQIDPALSSVCNAAKTLLASKNYNLKTNKSSTSKSKQKLTTKEKTGISENSTTDIDETSKSRQKLSIKQSSGKKTVKRKKKNSRNNDESAKKKNQGRNQSNGRHINYIYSSLLTSWNGKQKHYKNIENNILYFYEYIF